MARLKQVAALPVRRNRQGARQVMLVTSRETRRWVIPKGWPHRGIADYAAAAKEAHEEAGVVGETRRKRIGKYRYHKRRSRDVVEIDVNVYLLEVSEEKARWPEQHERKRAWFSLAAAAEAVEEEELKDIIATLESRE